MSADTSAPQSELVPGTPEYDAAMVAVAQAAANEGKPQRPEHVPEKFWDADKGEVRLDSLLKSYAELEAKQGSRAQQPAPPHPTNQAQPEQTAAPPTDQSAEQAVAAAGLDMASLESEYAEKGALSEESYAKLEKAGIARQYVDWFIEGRQALAEKQQQAIVSEVGGQQVLDAALNWAKTNLSMEDIQAYNAQVSASDLNTARNAVVALVARYERAVGKNPKLVTSGAPSEPAGGSMDAFHSLDEYIRAASDERYARDEYYRNQVIEKLLRSKIKELS